MALSASFAETDDKDAHDTVAVPKPSLRRRRLHILYLLNDLLHHTKYHNKSLSAFSTLTGTLQPHLVELFDRVASYQTHRYPKHHKHVAHLLDLWEKQKFFTPQYINKLRESVQNAARLDPAQSKLGKAEANGNSLSEHNGTSGQSAPFIMPATHGDPSTAYYDLPAANMMPHIVPNAAIPINPKLVRPLQLVAGPADESLIHALRDFMRDIESIDGRVDDPDELKVRDVDELGQTLYKDPTTGQVIGGDGYYGWSRTFCKKMRSRKARKGLPEPMRRERSDSSQRDFSLRKRARHGYSESDSNRVSSRGSSRSSSRSRSTSPARARHRQTTRAFSRSRDHYRGSSGSRSPLRRYRSLRSRSRSRSHSRSRSKSYSPPHASLGQQPVPAVEVRTFPGHPADPSLTMQSLYPGPFGHGFPLGPGGIPIPPPTPPPPNYTGIWPPPPPPLPLGMSFIPQPGVLPPFPGLASQPIPTPPPPSGPRGFQVPGSSTQGLQSQPQRQGPYGEPGGYGVGSMSTGNELSYNSQGRGGTRGGWRS